MKRIFSQVKEHYVITIVLFVSLIMFVLVPIIMPFTGIADTIFDKHEDAYLGYWGNFAGSALALIGGYFFGVSQQIQEQKNRSRSQYNLLQNDLYQLNSDLISVSTTLKIYKDKDISEHGVDMLVQTLSNNLEKCESIVYRVNNLILNNSSLVYRDELESQIREYNKKKIRLNSVLAKIAIESELPRELMNNLVTELYNFTYYDRSKIYKLAQKYETYINS
ncbi:hypothetical protein [Leuconostoc falkenbergense]|uniref:hypothetical protein n=1 Tax=Leuconostoc falkenbergense TaxID=2766470 RepID=UPI0028A5BDA5|nr:hypothetical protein [Leuconostoc falkenbergense]